MSLLLTSPKKLLSWYTRKNPVDLWLDLLRNAEDFEAWEEAALHLDNLLGLDHWYVSAEAQGATLTGGQEEQPDVETVRLETHQPQSRLHHRLE